MAAQTEVENTISSAWNSANQAMERMLSYSDKAVTYAQSFVVPADITDPSRPDKPEIMPPPTVDLNGIFGAEYNAEKAALKAELENRLKEFLDEYYPNYTTRLETVSSWIDNTIANGGTGLSAAVEQQIWDRARTREDATALKAENDVAAVWASRGFPLPPGVAAAQNLEIQQGTQNAVNALSRDIAIKQAELEQVNIQFAVAQGVSLHIGIIQVANNYMNSVISAAGQAHARAAALVDSIRALYAMTVNYYQAQIAAEELTLRYDTLVGSLEGKEIDSSIDAFRANINARVEAALSAAQSLGSFAAAAVGSQNTLAGITHNTEA